MNNSNLLTKIKEYHEQPTPECNPIVEPRQPMTLICELCRQPYAIVYKEELKLPLTGDMFHSHLPPDVPDPFNAGDGNSPILWPDMWCIYGRKHKPFLQPDTLTMQGDGLFVVTEKVSVEEYLEPFLSQEPEPKPKDTSQKPKPETIKCRFCGDVFTAKTSKLRHESNSCKKRPRR